VAPKVLRALAAQGDQFFGIQAEILLGERVAVTETGTLEVVGQRRAARRSWWCGWWRRIQA
jgi:hypothetical protein